MLCIVNSLIWPTFFKTFGNDLTINIRAFIACIISLKQGVSIFYWLTPQLVSTVVNINISAVSVL